MPVVDTETGNLTKPDLPTTSPQPTTIKNATETDLPGASPQPSSSSCITCKKAAEPGTALNRCGRCCKASYCSRECQKADWARHKPECVRRCTTNASGTEPGALFQSTIDRISSSVLFFIPEREVYRRLIDSFRLRVDDTYMYECKLMGVYAGDDPLPEFEEFLTKCEERAKDMMPSWWGPAARRDCIALATDESGLSYIRHGVEKADIQEIYGDTMMSLRLRVLAEKAYGRRITITQLCD